MKAVTVTLRRSIAAAAVVLAAPALSSCGSNFNAPTDQVYNPGVGVNDRSGTVALLHAAIVSGANGSGTVIGALVNQDLTEPDALTSVTGRGVTVSKNASLEIGPETLVQLATEGRYEATGQNVVPGKFVELTFAFQSAEQVTIEVPVVARSGAFAEVPVPSVAPSEPAASETPETAQH